MQQHWLLILVYGALISASVLGAMAVALTLLDFSAGEAVTVSFLTLALAQLWHVFNMREDNRHWLRNEVTGNAWVWGAVVLCLALLGAAVYLPALASVLSLAPPRFAGWLLVAGASVIPLLAGPLARRLAARPSQNAARLSP